VNNHSRPVPGEGGRTRLTGHACRGVCEEGTAVPEDEFVSFVPRHTMPPDEPYRLAKDANGILTITVVNGAPITPDFVHLLIAVATRRTAFHDQDSFGPADAVPSQRQPPPQRRTHPQPENRTAT
jgi:hypothetical protein